MNITQENVDELNAVLRVKVSAEDYLPKVESALKAHQKKASVPGFRPGKVPSGVIKKMYGRSVLVEAVNKLLNDSLYTYLNENKIEVLGNPLPKLGSHIDWDNQKDFEFLYEMGLAPKFNVELSANDKFTYKTVKIDEELINKYISDISKRYGKVENVDISSESDLLNGDFVELDANGEILAGGIFKTSSIFLDRVKDEATKKALIGLKKDDKVVLDAQKLADNPVDIATMLGIEKDAAEKITSKIQFTVKNISRLAGSDVNQELFDKIYGEGTISSAEEFKAKIKDELTGMFINDSERKFYNDVVEYLMNKINFNLPTEFLKRWIVAVNEKPVTPEQVETEFDGYSKGLKWSLIENKIIKDNNIQVTNEEVIESTKQMIIEQFGKYDPTPMDPEALNATTQRVLSNKDEAKKIYEKLYGEKVMALFKSKFTLENQELSYDDFFKNA
ncbi:MAG: trigger factor [Bacteroidota bacterium]